MKKTTRKICAKLQEVEVAQGRKVADDFANPSFLKKK